ncbi:hypothetical protein SteCoe_11640 [Stentor coeruleus]|uniref:Uncharacterized protein n=1 Tax=Stentor coeruleus TaxID=5963 RepID=A0A1R2CCS4_9CILI|nr:hypothetical protein SteCoe_11640 [Stentor coeruleus]
MGNKAPKSEPQQSLKEVPSRFLYVQGLNESNQCGKDGYPFNRDKCVVTAVGGMNHNLAILSNGEFVSWGTNEFGQLGTESDSYLTAFILEPTVICPISLPRSIGAIRIISISAGIWHSGCVSDAAQVFTWGLGTEGQLGINPRSFSLTKNPENGGKYILRPTIIDSLSSKNCQSIYCGSDYTIIKSSDHKVYSFGNGKEGVLGNGNTSSTHIPQEIQIFTGAHIKKIACGWNHCLALTSKGNVFQWGNQLKDILEVNEPILFPRIVSELENYFITDIACGDYHSCALSSKDPNVLFTWGSNGYGQLGIPSFDLELISYSPARVDVGDATQVICGGLFTMIRLKDNTVMAWGCNRQKQIGNGFANIVKEPSVILHKNIGLKRITCGYSHVMFLSNSMISKDEIINPESEVKRRIFHDDARPESSGDFTSDREEKMHPFKYR